MASSAIAHRHGPFADVGARLQASRATFVAVAASLSATLLLKFFPNLEEQLFARAAAGIVSFFTGYPVFAQEEGWMLPFDGGPIVVSAACSAVGYFTIVATLIAWQTARNGAPFLRATLFGVIAALPVTLFVNAVRIITVAHAHRMIIPRFPAHYDAFLHMATGVTVFLPSLIALNLVLETYGRSRSSARSAT